MLSCCHCCHVDFIGNLPGQQEPLPRPGKEGCSCQGTECYRKQRRNQDERSRNQTAYLCPVRSVRCGNLLLAVVPPERLLLTYFARDYVDLSVIDIDLGFTRIKGAEIFQCVNPFFVVFLTPFIMWLFGALKKKDKEPSTPMKIAIGMGIAALAYVFLMIFSFTLPAKDALSTMSAAEINAIRVTPWIMIGLYFILTVAELFISPLGLSFVSKVAPPHLQGLMQGCWLAATAVGNSLLFVGGILYTTVPIWACWLVFVGATGASMIVMLSMVKWLERVAK